MPWDAGGDQPRNYDLPGHWARLTAEPRAGWYSHRAVAPTRTGWALLPATAGYQFGTADAGDPARDLRPARGANGEAGLPTGDTAGAVVWLEWDGVKPGYIIVGGGGVGGSGGSAVVRTAAANDGTQWTAAVLLGYDAAGEFVDGAAVRVKPFPGFTCRTSDYWLAVSTGSAAADPVSPPPPPPPGSPPPPPPPVSPPPPTYPRYRLTGVLSTTLSIPDVTGASVSVSGITFSAALGCNADGTATVTLTPTGSGTVPVTFPNAATSRTLEADHLRAS